MERDKIIHELTNFSWLSVLHECYRKYSVEQFSYNISGFILSLKFQRTSASMAACF